MILNYSVLHVIRCADVHLHMLLEVVWLMLLLDKLWSGGHLLPGVSSPIYKQLITLTLIFRRDLEVRLRKKNKSFQSILEKQLQHIQFYVLHEHVSKERLDNRL